MKSPIAGLRIAALAGIVLMLAACSSTSDGTGSADSSSMSGQGGPGSAAPGSQQDLAVNVGDRVFFEFDQSSLSQEARATLQRQAAWMKLHQAVTVTVEGHCDERGTREYNLALGARRANASKEYLVSLGVDPARVRTISYGKERPVALCSDESCWSQNRRAVSVVNTGAGS